MLPEYRKTQGASSAPSTQKENAFFSDFSFTLITFPNHLLNLMQKHFSYNALLIAVSQHL
ncbi:MAG TPA: hypothetical protein DIW40_14240 [Halomonas sp.]|nr:hypothetical protein [Halomonas sp.]